MKTTPILISLALILLNEAESSAFVQSALDKLSSSVKTAPPEPAPQFGSVLEMSKAIAALKEFKLNRPDLPDIHKISDVCTSNITTKEQFVHELTSPALTEAKLAEILKCPKAAEHLKTLTPTDIIVNGANFTVLLDGLKKKAVRGNLQIDLHRDFIRCIDKINEHLPKILNDRSSKEINISHEIKTIEGLDGCMEPGMKEQIEKMGEVIKEANKRDEIKVRSDFTTAVSSVVNNSPYYFNNLKTDIIKFADSNKYEARAKLEELLKSLKTFSPEQSLDPTNVALFKAAMEGPAKKRNSNSGKGWPFF